MKETPQDIIEQVEKFINKIDQMDYVIKLPEYKETYRRSPFENIVNNLAREMTRFRIAPIEIKLKYAFDCSTWIDQAFSHHLIHEGKGLIRKYRECSEKNMELQKENQKFKEHNQKLSTEIIHIQGRYDELKEQYEELNKRYDQKIGRME